MNRRLVLQTAGGALLGRMAQSAETGPPLHIVTVSPHTVRLTIGAGPVPQDGAVTAPSRKPGSARVKRSPDGRTITITGATGAEVQQLTVDPDSGVLLFRTGDGPLLGLGEGGPQFDRRGSADRMRSGQGGYRLSTNGGRVPIPWVISAGGWALFVHQPLGAFDFSGEQSKFTPADPAHPFPLDLFLVTSRDPSVIMGEYARITGYPEMPALWTLGYQQSHRTLESTEAVLDEAKTFREKKLPCDTLIYLGTGFCPSGWNTNNTEFTFNQKIFPDPKAVIDQLHRDHFKVVLHVAYPTRIPQMHGTVKDACDPKVRAELQPSCYWETHRPVFALG